MMEFIIRNKWLTLRGGSYVKDINEKDVRKVVGKFFTFTRKKRIYDMEGNLKYVVRNKFWKLFAHRAYVISPDGHKVAKIRRKIFSLHDRYFIKSDLGEIEIKGNILGYNYHIWLNGVEVAHIARKISLRDSFVLSINDGLDYDFFIALVIAVDNITDEIQDDNRRS